MSSQPLAVFALEQFAEVQSKYDAVIAQICRLNDEVRKMQIALASLKNKTLINANNELIKVVDNLLSHFSIRTDIVELVVDQNRKISQAKAITAVESALRDIATQSDLTCYWPTSKNSQTPVEVLGALLLKWQLLEQAFAEYSCSVTIKH